MKPVAWIDPYDLERLPLNDCWVNGQKSKWVDLPLYTHPVKELTDEEIKQLYENSFDWDKRNLWTFNYNDFARAILRKAQE